MDAHPDPDPDGPAARFDRRELHDLLHGISGELRRPLTSLRMGFDLLLGGGEAALSAARAGHVATMRELCDDLLGLTRGYLDYAEVIRDPRPPFLGSYSLAAIVGEADRAFAAAAREKGLGWSAEVEGGDASLITDASRCQLILAALVSNAVKFTPPGGRVRVAGRVDADSWSLAVTDDGPGMTPDEARRAFEPFYRLPRDEHSAEGNGLGLSTALELATRLGGRVELTAREGGGVTAVAVFPREVPSAEPAADRH